MTHHLQILGTSQGSDVSRLSSDIIDDRRFKPRDLKIDSVVSFGTLPKGPRLGSTIR